MASIWAFQRDIIFIESARHHHDRSPCAVFLSEYLHSVQGSWFVSHHLAYDDVFRFLSFCSSDGGGRGVGLLLFFQRDPQTLLPGEREASYRDIIITPFSANRWHSFRWSSFICVYCNDQSRRVSGFEAQHAEVWAHLKGNQETVCSLEKGQPIVWLKVVVFLPLSRRKKKHKQRNGHTEC